MVYGDCTLYFRYVIQPSFIAHNKHRKFVLMFFHALSVTGVVSIVMYIFGIFTVLSVSGLLISHIIIDTWKSRQPKDDEHFWCIYVDQFLHFVFIVMASL